MSRLWSGPGRLHLPRDVSTAFGLGLAAIAALIVISGADPLHASRAFVLGAFGSFDRVSVALNTFAAVFMRKFFAVTIPDYYNFGQFMLGVLIFWGIAATSYRGTHITVDLVWANATPKYQRLIDVFATLVLLFVVSVQTYTLFDKVASTRADNVLTFDLNLPTWPFFALAWAGDVSAVLLIAVRTYRLIFRPELMADGYQIKPVE